MEIDESPEGAAAYGGISHDEAENQNGRRRPWNRIKNNNPKLLLILGLCILKILIIITVVSISILVSWLNQPTVDENNVCLTPKCTHEATRIMKYLDDTANPCDDFYKFSCGNYLKKTIPDDDILISVLGDIDNKYRIDMRNVIENNKHSNSSHYLALQTFYNNCMDRAKIEEHGLQTISKIIKDFGGWPVVEGNSWQSEQFDWIGTVGNFTRIGFMTDYLFKFRIGYNLTNVRKNMYEIGHPRLELSSKFLINGMSDKFVNAYYKYIVDVAVSFGANRTRAKKELKQLMDFQIDLAKCFVPPEDQRNMFQYNNPMMLQELEEKYGNISWNDYYRRVIRSPMPLRKNSFITVNVPEYFEKLNILIAKTDKRTLGNYVFWKSIESVMKYLPNKVREAEFNYRTVREGITEHKPRWIECIDTSLRVLDSPLITLYYDNAFNKSAVAPTEEIVQKIYEEFLEMIEKNDWMDAITKEKALNKAKAVKFQIANDHQLLTQKALETDYKGLDLKADGNYLESFLSVKRHFQPITTDDINELLGPWTKSEASPFEGPAILNPYYNTVFNEIGIPAGILRAPFMDDDRPKYLNFATVGFIVGHELTHGFDDVGHQFDINGNLIDWWDEETKNHFKSKANCFVYQYGNYTCKEINEKLNGIVSLGENMADNAAVKVSYLAYQKWVNEYGAEKKLPGLNYSPQQLFWINSAQIWCSKYRPEILREMVVTDQHSPEEFRIKGSFSNSRAFAEDFQCPVGSQMNPEKKCSVW